MVSSTFITSGMRHISVMRHEQNGKQHTVIYTTAPSTVNSPITQAIRRIPLVMKVLLTILFMSYYSNTTHTNSDEDTAYHSVHVVFQKYDAYVTRSRIFVVQW
jgi:hypothetical protein